MAMDPRQLAQLIDAEIDQQLAAAGVEPVPPVADHGFIRRATLDLAGRVPTAAELEAFVTSKESEKRTRLIAKLVDSPDFAFHQRNELDTLLLRRLQHHNEWREYLLEATRENRGWDQIFREVMLPEDHAVDDARPVTFLKERIRDLDAATNDTSILWFGVNVGCAKCHDHPLVDDWTQAHYYGLASFFKRTFQTRRGSLGERLDGQIKFTNVFGEETTAEFMFLTGTTVKEPELSLSEDELKKLNEAIKQAEKDDKADPPPKLDFRPRAELVDLALGDTEQRFFAKNIVNRTWARIFGRGLVHPLDQMHSENPASHPQLLDRLAGEMITNGYNLKSLVQAIALTRVYARQSANPGEKPPPELFAAASVRPLSPHQLSLSCRLATSSPDRYLGLAQADDSTQTEDWETTRESLEQQAEGFARTFEIPDDGFQVSVTEALWFSNNASVEKDLLGAGGDKLVGYLRRLDSDAEVAIRAFRSVLCRAPAAEELGLAVDYLHARADRREQAIGQLVWSLLSSPEFRFNH